MKEVNAVIITIGDELLIGQTIDTNSAFIAQQLNSIGIWVKKRIAIGDDRDSMLATLQVAAADYEVVIITGGLGPTDDDITKPVLCDFFGASLKVDAAAEANVREIFTKLNRPLTERNLKQAELPDNCIALPNRRGSAPGMWFEKNFDGRDVIFIALPGVPHEMRGLIETEVIPKLQGKLQLPSILHRTLVTSGIGESFVADILLEFEKNLPAAVKLAYLPSYGTLRLRLTCRAENEAAGIALIQPHFENLQLLAGKWMVANEDISLAEALNRLLIQKNKTLSTAESCTGGYIAHLLTSHAGASAVFKGAVVAYANEVKENILAVNNATLSSQGAVSEATIIEMANGALEQLGSDYVIATSGIMGPGGGSEEKPVGTVWIAVGNKERIHATKAFFRYDRSRNIEMTAQTALSLLFRFIKDAGKE